MKAPQARRPTMPRGYGLADSSEGVLPWAWAEQRLVQARNYWLVTASPEGRPHAAPVWGVWLGGAFWFSTDPTSRKGRHLQENPYVVVHLESGDEALVLEGLARRVTEPSQWEAVGPVYEGKYAFRPDPQDPAYGLYMVQPLKVLAWQEADFPRSATRWTFA